MPCHRSVFKKDSFFLFIVCQLFCQLFQKVRFLPIHQLISAICHQWQETVGGGSRFAISTTPQRSSVKGTGLAGVLSTKTTSSRWRNAKTSVSPLKLPMPRLLPIPQLLPMPQLLPIPQLLNMLQLLPLPRLQAMPKLFPMPKLLPMPQLLTMIQLVPIRLQLLVPKLLHMPLR